MHNYGLHCYLDISDYVFFSRIYSNIFLVVNMLMFIFLPFEDTVRLASRIIVFKKSFLFGASVCLDIPLLVFLDIYHLSSHD